MILVLLTWHFRKLYFIISGLSGNFFGQFKWISQNKGLFSLKFPLKKQLYPHFKRVYYFGGDGAHSWVCTAQTNALKQKPTRYSRKNKKIVEVLVVFISFSTVSMRRNRGVCMCIYFYDVWCGIPKTRPHIPTFNICWSFFFVRGRPHCCYFFTYSLAISLCTPWCTLFIPFNFLYVTFLFLFIFQKHMGHKIPFNTSERKKMAKKMEYYKKKLQKKRCTNVLMCM